MGARASRPQLRRELNLARHLPQRTDAGETPVLQVMPLNKSAARIPRPFGRC